MTRLHHATQQGELRADADHDAIANALIGTLLLKLLSSTAPGDGRATRFDGLLDAILQGASGVACEGGGEPLQGNPRALHGQRPLSLSRNRREMDRFAVELRAPGGATS